MNIWNILGIEPTNDIKTIKRAYAAKTKVIHPEEKPEDFQLLYEAYQLALQQAKRGEAFSTKSIIPDQEATKKAVQEDEQENELLSYLANTKKQEEERLAAAKEYLEDAWKKYRRPEEREWLKGYLGSKEFLDIRWHPQVVHLLAEEFQKPVYYKYDEIWLHLWKLYGFREQEEEVYQGEVKKLRDILYTSHERRQQELKAKELYEQKRQEEQRKQEILGKIYRVVLIILCIVIPLLIYYSVTYERRFIAKYMAEKYPNTEFSKPKKGEKDGEGRRIYHFISSTHPDFQITAVVRYREASNGRYVVEDYGLQLLDYYTGQYGLECGRIEKEGYNWPDSFGDDIGVLYYSDSNKIGEFCYTVTQMFQEQEELQDLEAVGVCKTDVLYPEILIHGGLSYFFPSEPQFYRPWEMEASELEKQIRAACMQYMFHFEAWNLTLEQYSEWGPAYEEMCKELEEEYSKKANDSGSWLSLHQEGEVQEFCNIYLPIYMELEFDYHLGTTYTKMMPIGDVYHYLLVQGALVTVAEDGSGFFVKKGENSRFFGEEAREQLTEVKKWLPLASLSLLE